MPDYPKLLPNKLQLHAVQRMHILNDYYYFKPIKSYAITITPIGNQISLQTMMKRIHGYLKHKSAFLIAEQSTTNHFHGIIYLPYDTPMYFNWPQPANFASPTLNIKLVDMKHPRGWLGYMYKDTPNFNLCYHNNIQEIYNRYPKKQIKPKDMKSDLRLILKKKT